MNLFARVIATLYTLILTALAVAVVGVSAGGLAPPSYLDYYLVDISNRWAVGLVAAAGVVLGVYALLGTLQRPSAPSAVVQSSSLGAVTITTSALEATVIRAARQVRGVREVRTHLDLRPAGVIIRLDLGLNPETSVPEVSKELQERVSEYVRQMAGLEVLEIRVRVENVGQENRGRVE